MNVSTFNGAKERADISFDLLEHVGHVAIVQLVTVDFSSYDLQAHRVLLLHRQAQPGFQSVVVQIEELADHWVEQLNDLPTGVECLRQMIVQKLVDRLQRRIVGEFELDLLSIVHNRGGNHRLLKNTKMPRVEVAGARERETMNAIERELFPKSNGRIVRDLVSSIQVD